jgi:hypothetical protein
MAAALAAIAVFFLTRGTPAPATRVDALVPADALLYLHVSTDPDREQDQRLLALLKRFPASTGAVLAYEVAKPWLGDEAGFVLARDGSAAILSVRDRDKAPDGRYVRGFLVLGDQPLVDRIGKGKALRLPERADDRAADLYVAPERVPAPFTGHAITAELVPTDAGVRITARQRGGADRARDFEPRLLEAVPEDAFAYASLRGLDVPGMPELVRPLAGVLDGEVAVSIAPGTGDPVVTLIARTSDAAAAREALAGLQGTAAAVLTGSGEATGQVPVFEERSLDGQDAYVLTLAGGGELVYTVAGDRVIVSSREEGVTRALRGGDGLGEAEAFRSVTDAHDRVQALAFVAANQLLELADESGLDAAEAYRAVRPNLARIRALGAVVRRQGNDTTAELNLLIP